MFDLLITGGCYPDFESGCLRQADIAVRDGKIAAILEPGGEKPEASRVVDANGRIVSPGFIDIHMHEEEFPDGDHGYDISCLLAKQGVTTGVNGNCGLMSRRVADFRRILEENGGAPINHLPLSGYNFLRAMLGVGWYDPAPEAVRRTIQAQLREDMAAGAWGFTFGLEYFPGISTEEMTEAVMALRDLDPFIAIHFRADCEGCLPSLHEMAQLSRDTGCRVEVSHLSSLAGSGGNMTESLAFLEREMAENPKLGYDTYPYTAFSTAIGSAVFDMDWCSKWHVGYDSIMLTHEPYVGQRCDKALFEKVRRETPEARVVAFAMDDESIRAAIVHPAALFGSDGNYTRGNACHPRAGGTFPRILGKYVREEGALSLMEALDKMTRRNARRIGLASKGEILPGYDADLVIFDPGTISDGPTYTDFDRPNTGIDMVMIAGIPTVEHNRMTGALPGRFLAR